jgi:hypothetical protein
MNRSRWIVSAAALLVVALAAVFGLTRNEASANQPNAALEFTLHVGGCSTLADYKGTCTVTQGSTFVASVSLDAIPGAYDALGVTVAYTGVASKDNPDMVWPQCVLEAVGAIPPFVYSGCAIGISAPPSTFTGTVFTASFNCVGDGTLSLTHGPADTLLIGANGKTNTEAGPDVLNIDCAPPTITPTPSITPTPTPEPVGGLGLEADGDDDASPGSTTGVALAVLTFAALGGAGWGAIHRRRAR